MKPTQTWKHQRAPLPGHGLSAGNTKTVRITRDHVLEEDFHTSTLTSKWCHDTNTLTRIHMHTYTPMWFTIPNPIRCYSPCPALFKNKDKKRLYMFNKNNFHAILFQFVDGSGSQVYRHDLADKRILEITCRISSLWNFLPPSLPMHT